jgi:hypothetical protein
MRGAGSGTPGWSGAAGGHRANGAALGDRSVWETWSTLAALNNCWNTIWFVLAVWWVGEWVGGWVSGWVGVHRRWACATPGVRWGGGCAWGCGAQLHAGHT